MSKKTKKKQRGKTEQDRVTYAMARKRLSDLRAGSAEATAESSQIEEETKEQEEREAARRRDLRENATALIVAATFEASVTKETRRRLMHGQALAAVVVVPGPAWVAPITAYFKSTYGSRWCVHVRDGADRKSDASFGSVDAARDLSKGFCVAGIAADPKLLPASLQSAADVTVRVAPPDHVVLRRAIAKFAGRSPGDLEAAGIAAGLDLAEIVAAFRPGKGAAAIVARLAAARRSHVGSVDRVPDLETAVEYGEARNWGLNLASDVAAYKAGTLEWQHLDRGICLHSKLPGLGKSTFCISLAKACRIPVVSTTAGEWFSQGPGYLHSVVQRFRAEVAKAMSLANPVCLLAIEEVDAAVPNRATLSNHAREWHNILISDILATLDSSLGAASRLIMVASTNQIELVDPALLRPGRLEKTVEILPPDADGAINIMRFHLNGELQDDLSSLGPLFAGRTGADIMYAVRVARRAARHAGRALTVEDLARAALPVEEIAPARLFRMSVHEAAHAVAAIRLGIGTVRHVVLRQNGASAGQTVVAFDEADLTTRAVIEDRTVAALAGRAAEILFTGSASAGSGGDPQSDVGSATIDVAAMHASLAMGDRLAYRGAGADLLQQLAMDRELRERVEADLRRLEARAASLVAANGAAILAVAERLAERRFVGGDEIEAIVRAHPGTAAARARSGPRGPLQSNP